MRLSLVVHGFADRFFVTPSPELGRQSPTCQQGLVISEGDTPDPEACAIGPPSAFHLASSQITNLNDPVLPRNRRQAAVWTERDRGNNVPVVPRLLRERRRRRIPQTGLSIIPTGQRQFPVWTERYGHYLTQLAIRLGHRLA
jgi:hypothetical protein